MVIVTISGFFVFYLQESVPSHLTKDIIQIHKESLVGAITRERSSVGFFSREFTTYN